MHWSWPHVRAIVITLVLGWQMAMAVPLPERRSAAHFDDQPVVRRELDRWVGVLEAMGVPLTRSQVIQAYVAIADATNDVRAAVLRPGRPLVAVFRIGQGWGLFAVPTERPLRLVIEAHDASGEGGMLYRRGELEPRPLRGLLRNRRLRAVYDTARMTGPARTACVWVARGILDRYAGLDTVTISRERTRTTLPGAPHRDELTQLQLCTVRRDAP